MTINTNSNTTIMNEQQEQQEQRNHARTSGRNKLSKKFMLPALFTLLGVGAGSVSNQAEAQTIHTHQEQKDSKQDKHKDDKQTFHFGQRWFDQETLQTHECDETCVPVLTEQEWEEQQQKMREMEERASTRADSVYTDERYPPEDLLPEGTIMNAYIIYNTEIYNLLENGADDSLQLQAELEKNLHAISEAFYNAGMLPTPTTPIFNVVGIQSDDRILYENPTSALNAMDQTMTHLRDAELAEKLKCKKVSYLVYWGDFSNEAGLPGAPGTGMRSGGINSRGFGGTSVMNFRRGTTNRFSPIGSRTREILHNHETGHHLGVGHDTGGPRTDQARAGEIMRIPTQSTLTASALGRGTVCANGPERRTFATDLITEGSSLGTRDNRPTIRARIDQMQFTPLSLSLSAQQIDGEPIDLTPDMPVELTTADTIVFNGMTNRGDELETDQIEHTRYLQDEDGNVIATHTGQTYEFHHDTPGNYTIEHRADQGCYSKKDTIEVKIDRATNTNTFQPTLEKGLRVYPNPTAGTITLDAHPELIQHVTQYEIVNMMGQTVRQEAFAGQEINIADLTAGTYILKITTDTGTATEHLGIPIIKQ